VRQNDIGEPPNPFQDVALKRAEIGQIMTHNAPTQPWSLVRRRIARRERLFRRFVDEGVLVSAKDFLFGLEPVVEFQARLPASPEVEFVGPSPDLFFE